MQYKTDLHLNSSGRIQKFIFPLFYTNYSDDQTRKIRYYNFFSNNPNEVIQSLGFFLSHFKDIPSGSQAPVIFPFDFIQKLYFLFLQKDFPCRKEAFRLICKILNYQTTMINDLLSVGIMNYIGSNFPSNETYKLCFKLAKIDRELQFKFYNDNILFMNQSQLNRINIKYRVRLFDSLINKIYDSIDDKYFDFCYGMINSLSQLKDEFDESTRFAIIHSFNTLSETSISSMLKIIQKNILVCMRDQILECDLMKEMSKRELLEIVYILTRFVKNPPNLSQYIIENGFIEWILLLIASNAAFESKRLFSNLLTFFAESIYNNHNSMQNPELIDYLFQIFPQYDSFNFTVKNSLNHLLYTLILKSSDDLFYQILSRNFHLKILNNANIADIPSQIDMLNAILRIYDQCPVELLNELCEESLQNEDLIKYLEDVINTKNANYQNSSNESNTPIHLAQLILQKIHQTSI